MKGACDGQRPAAYAINGDTFDTQVNGSASILHDSGFNLTAAAGQRTIDDPLVPLREDPFFWYAKVGYILKRDNGSTAFAIDFAQADDVEADGDEFTTVGAAVVQKYDSIGTEIYLGVRNHTLENTPFNPDDIIAVLAGARVKF
ncbi:MAG: hypothetical protein OEN55_16405 [Alphaproteobacteria bacterium]|nr:hypothetical protein [Alphaproteobacteria bacterium]